MAEYSATFQGLYAYLSTKPLLIQPRGETLYLYMAVSSEAVNSILIREEENVQKSVYYMSQNLKAGELNYIFIEKAAFTLITTVDGSSGEAGSRAGVVLRSPNGVTHEHSISFDFLASNNEAKYKALLTGLRGAQALKVEYLYLLADSQLVVHQVNEQYTTKDPRRTLYLKAVKFDNEGFQSFCEEYNIRRKFSSVAHPKSNKLSEVANKCILQVLKKKVDVAGGNWVEELPGILWFYRTTYNNSTGKTPFKLAYGTKVVTPVKVGIPTI
ncbi:uncharacterized protein A4U43_C01F15970 [Asparagus officinalis]|uniref:Integrase catalytic domain-containing protein n=1 Tax=Asparagus officinalis TaxID=4686 RepID=A0A5P1FPY6_ASPOF|nr:uncharacterized protein A4U43_C01F15970 [Asparagus officinalis]